MFDWLIGSKIKLALSIGVLAAMAALGVYVWSLQVRLDAKQQQLEAAQAALKQCQVNNKTLEAAVDTQNKALDALESTAIQQQQLATEALSEARKVGEALELRTKQLLAQRRPQAMSACDFANKVINDEIARPLPAARAGSVRNN